jgi:hypothetical protein
VQLSDIEFWSMVSEFSEDGGSFVSDNIISNEIEFQRIIPAVQRRVSRGVYIGVGPEQNFTYITAFKPDIAFIVDLRRANVLLHLAYKALVEQSADRVDCMSRLFARPRPAVGANASAKDLLDAFESVTVSEPLANDVEHGVIEWLERTHRFPLTGDDEKGIGEILRAFRSGGPSLRGDFGGGSWIPSFKQLMSTADPGGRNHSFLDSDETFQLLKQYEIRNLIVPVVGDFAGGRALRRVGGYASEHHAHVTTFYTSNVEEYLFKNGSWKAFVDNLARLPITKQSMLIRSFFTHSSAGLHTLIDPFDAFLSAVRHREIRTYADVIARSK